MLQLRASSGREVYASDVAALRQAVGDPSVGRVVLPAGVFELDEPLRVPRAVWLVGAGSGTAGAGATTVLRSVNCCAVIWEDHAARPAGGGQRAAGGMMQLAVRREHAKGELLCSSCVDAKGGASCAAVHVLAGAPTVQQCAVSSSCGTNAARPAPMQQRQADHAILQQLAESLALNVKRVPPGSACRTIVVNDSMDPPGFAPSKTDVCRLRDAVLQANAIDVETSPTVVIQLPRGRIQLAAELPLITRDVAIIGVGEPKPDWVTGVITVPPNAPGTTERPRGVATQPVSIIDAKLVCAMLVATAGTKLWLQNVSFRNGASGAGGAVFTQGSLDLFNTVFTGCRGINGGAVYHEGPVNIDNSVFTHNRADRCGGALFSAASARLNVAFCDFSYNSDNSWPTGEDTSGVIFNGPVIGHAERAQLPTDGVAVAPSPGVLDFNSNPADRGRVEDADAAAAARHLPARLGEGPQGAGAAVGQGRPPRHPPGVPEDQVRHPGQDLRDRELRARAVTPRLLRRHLGRAARLPPAHHASGHRALSDLPLPAPGAHRGAGAPPAHAHRLRAAR
jgi:hypothetical protein